MTKSQQIKSTDVWLRETKTDSLNTFHCNNCGTVLFQHLQGVQLIVPAKSYTLREFNKLPEQRLDGEYKKPPIIVRCRNCKTQYNIR